MAIDLRVEVTDDDGTLASYRVMDADEDGNRASRMAWLMGYAFQATAPFLQGEWDDVLVSLMDVATEHGFTPMGDDAVREAFKNFVRAGNTLAQAKVNWRRALDKERVHED